MDELFDINKLIGIPFKINRRDFLGSDCRGIVWLYYRYVLGKDMPFSDGKRVIFRNRKNDIQRMKDGYSKIANPVSFNELQEGDIVIFQNFGAIGALGVCINNRQILHMDKIVGSCLTKLSYLKEFFVTGYRPYV